MSVQKLKVFQFLGHSHLKSHSLSRDRFPFGKYFSLLFIQMTVKCCILGGSSLHTATGYH